MKHLIFILLFMIPGVALSTVQDPVGIEMELVFVQKTNTSFSLKAIVVDEEDGEPVNGLPLLYSVSINDQSIDLGKATTNNEGVAVVKGTNLNDLRKIGHLFSFTVSFEGNPAFSENETSIEIKDATVILTHEVVDSVYTVFAKVTTWDDEGEEIPVEDIEVLIYVPRLFSLLPVTDISTDEEGVGEAEFASDIPGGPNGELKIIARIEEHEEFGTIESSIETTWGVKALASDKKLPRALWSPDAPLWMVITFTLLMTVVWYHYFLIIYRLVRLKKSGAE